MPSSTLPVNGYVGGNVQPALPEMPSLNKVAGPKVDYCRPDYLRMLPKWIVMNDVVEGQDTIKLKGAAYLPVPYTSNDANENMKRYASYKDRAIFYNVTRRTLAGLVGEVFTTDPVLELPSNMDMMKLDVDGGGVTLDQQARQTLARILTLGRCGLYVDYPTTQADGQVVASKRDEIVGNLRPMIYSCHPNDVINWRLELIGGRRLLTLVVIREQYVVNDDGFAEELAVQYRALRLGKNPDGQLYYYQQIYRKNNSGNYVQFEQDIIPVDFSGKTFDEILFTFVGADNNDSSVTEPPLYDLACVNIGHYRNSADYEETCFMLGNPTPYFTGLTDAWVKNTLKGEIMLGSRAAVPLPVGATAGLLQVQPNTMVLEALKHKEDQMRALGAKLVDSATTVKTATQDYRESIEDSSILAVCAVNVSTAYSACLRWASRFVGNEEAKVEYTLNTDFSTSKMTPAERLQLMKEWQGGAISFTEYRFRLHRANVAWQEDETAQAEIDAETQKEMQQQAERAALVKDITTANASIDNQRSTGGNL